MKQVWKKRAVVVSVLLLVCAAVYSFGIDVIIIRLCKKFYSKRFNIGKR